MGLILDTNVLLAFGRRGPDLAKTLRGYADMEVAMAAISAGELVSGTVSGRESARPARRAFVDELLGYLPVLPFGLPEAREYGRLSAAVSGRVTPLTPHHMLVAATALSVGWALLTLTPADYGMVDGLVLAPLRAE